MNIFIQTDKNKCEYILFRIDIYFTEYFLAVEIGEKGHTDRDLIFEEKRQKALEKNLTVNLLDLILVEKIMMRTMKLVQYRRLSVSLKRKRTKNEIKKLKLKLTNQSAQNNDDNDRK